MKNFQCEFFKLMCMLLHVTGCGSNVGFESNMKYGFCKKKFNES